MRASPYADLGKDDRAALIKIAEHETFIAPLMRTSSLASPQTLWAEFGRASQVLARSYDKKPAPDKDPAVETRHTAPVDPSRPLSPDREGKISGNDKPKPVRRYSIASKGTATVANVARTKLAKEFGKAASAMAAVSQPAKPAPPEGTRRGA